MYGIVMYSGSACRMIGRSFDEHLHERDTGSTAWFGSIRLVTRN